MSIPIQVIAGTGVTKIFNALYSLENIAGYGVTCPVTPLAQLVVDDLPQHTCIPVPVPNGCRSQYPFELYPKVHALSWYTFVPSQIMSPEKYVEYAEANEGTPINFAVEPA